MTPFLKQEVYSTENATWGPWYFLDAFKKVNSNNEDISPSQFKFSNYRIKIKKGKEGKEWKRNISKNIAGYTSLQKNASQSWCTLLIFVGLPWGIVYEAIAIFIGILLRPGHPGRSQFHHLMNFPMEPDEAQWGNVCQRRRSSTSIEGKDSGNSSTNGLFSDGFSWIFIDFPATRD